MTAPVDLPQLTAMQFDRRLLSDLRAVLAHHAFTRDRIGQPGCEVRKVAAEHAETIERAIAELTAARERLAELESAIEGAIKDVEQGNLYSTMCCSGHECGCRGSSYADLLVHDLRATLQPENPND